MVNDNTRLLVDTVQELSLARDIGRVMEIVRTAARSLTGADGATFVLREGEMSYYADEDAIATLWKGSRFPLRTCISGWAMLNRQTAVIEDIYLDDRIPHDAYAPTFVKSLAMVPIRTLDPLGAIGTYWATKFLPTPDQVTLLQSLADVTAVTIENVNMYRDLEQRVKDRTAQLEAANLELEAFSYSVSHDLRSPLRRIIGYAEILGEECANTLGDKGKETLAIVQKNALQMDQLISDLLRFSRLGESALQKGEVINDRLVTTILEGLPSHLKQRLTLTLQPLPSVIADANLITQVWTNLISNAVKYSSTKVQLLLEIGSYRTPEEVVFYVKDNGVGFDMKYANRLFAVFQRLHNAKDFEGTGIGLALVKRIVTRHGGRVWAESQPNEGATFYYSLPL